jgi:type VI secretion system protein VasG
MTTNLKALVTKLNGTCRSALENSAGLCVSRMHYEVDVEHFLLKLTEVPDSDLCAIYRHFDIASSRMSRDLTRALDKFKSGNARNPALSPRIAKLLSEAWSIASVDFSSAQVRSGFILVAILATDELSRLVLESCPELRRISLETLKKDLFNICAHSSEDLSDMRREPGDESERQEQPAAHAASKTPNLDQYTNNLTEAARAGKIDPVLGRDSEIRGIIDILMRRRQNNPILTGEPGVGKTAVVEGFALRIAAGTVPPALSDVELRVLDLGLLQAGAGVKGEFENRLKGVISEVKSSPKPIILFIDEAHTMIGAGGQAGQNDAANLLKPALARGELRTIAATTWSEYKKYFEKDAALARRFQVIKVEEPTEAQAMAMMRGLAVTLEKHHKVRILDNGLNAAVQLSHRYITGRQLPDKAVSVLDTACARVALAQNAKPAALEDAEREVELLETELRVIKRENAASGLHTERLIDLGARKSAAEIRVVELQTRLGLERALVQRVLELRWKIEEFMVPQAAAATATGPVVVTRAVEPTEIAELRGELTRANLELSAAQGDAPLVKPFVDDDVIAEVIAGWTGIPVGKMLRDEIQTVLALNDILAQRIIGQEHALDAIAQRIRTAKAGLDDPRRPIGVFLLVGPSGVGKTETALALADTLYGGERNLVTINMSEYQEAHSISGLKGSPPGYVGYGEGGVLTEAVRRKPYSVVLLDEMEKAHQDVMELFYQVFDKGFMEDGEGREVDFKNTVILMTSNAASDMVMKACSVTETRPDTEELAELIGPELRRVFKPALLGRLIVVPYYPIDDESLHEIIKLKLEHISRRVEETHRMPFTYSGELVSEIALRCTEVESGARNVDHILTATLLPQISEEILVRMADGKPVGRVHVSVGESDHALQYEVA